MENTSQTDQKVLLAADVQEETPIATRILQMQNQGYDCSVGNIMEADRKKNFDLIPNLEKLYSLLKPEEIEDFFMSNDVTAQHLAKFLHTFNVLANSTLYKLHDGQKARDIVQRAKRLAEQYMKGTSKLTENFDFDAMDDEDMDLLLASEVDEDLLRMYTILIYFQGRSYIYENKDLAEGKKYFVMCRKLGKKLNMFEGYLSIGRGVLVIELFELEEKIKAKNIAQEAAINQLKDHLNQLKELKTDDNEYIEGYKPGQQEKQIAKPSVDSYNLIECSEQEIRHYNWLIELTTDQDQLADYAKEVLIIFSNIFELFKNTKINPRKKMSVYNNMGFILLGLYDKHQDLTELRTEVSNALVDGLSVEPTVSDLRFIEAMFQFIKAQQNSETPEFTHAETYEGLCKVYERLAKLSGSGQMEYDEICESLAKCSAKKEEINKALNRNKNR
jgi:hypothetical protein